MHNINRTVLASLIDLSFVAVIVLRRFPICDLVFPGNKQTSGAAILRSRRKGLDVKIRYFIFYEM